MINVQHYVCLPQCPGEGYQSLVTHGQKNADDTRYFANE